MMSTFGQRAKRTGEKRRMGVTENGRWGVTEALLVGTAIAECRPSVATRRGQGFEIVDFYRAHAASGALRDA